MTLKLWDTEAGREVLALEGHTHQVMGCTYSPDGARVLSASLDGTLKAWEAVSGECVATVSLLDGAFSVVHHPHRARVVCSEGGG
jgi:WD40 repeat protein